MDTQYELEKQAVRFKIVTRLSVEDVYKFYLSEARYPTPEETDAINFFGIDKFLDVAQRFRRMPVPPLLKTDLEKLASARERFHHELAKRLEKFIETVKRKLG